MDSGTGLRAGLQIFRIVGGHFEKKNKKNQISYVVEDYHTTLYLIDNIRVYF